MQHFGVPPHHTGLFPHAPPRRLPFLASWCKSKRTLWNAPVMWQTSPRGKHRSSGRVANGGWVWINTFIFSNRLPTVTGRVCVFTLEVTVSYCIRYFTSCQAIKEVFEMSKDSNMTRTGNCLLGEIWLLMIMRAVLIVNFRRICTV